MNIRLLLCCLIISCFHTLCWTQKHIECSSGQTIVLDGANNFLYSNGDSLSSKYESSNETEKKLYTYLLNVELQNRLKAASISKEMAIHQYDLGRAGKNEKSNYKAKIKTLEKDLKAVNDNYKLIGQELKKMTKHDQKGITQLLFKYNKVLEEGKVDTKQSTPKDDYADDKVEPIEKHKENKIEPSDLEKQEKSQHERSKSHTTNSDCNVAFVGKNNQNKKQTLLHHERLLTYTPDKVKSYYKLSHFLIINAALEKLDGKMYLNIEARFDSKDALKSYGKIHKSDFLRIEFISGKKLFLTSTEIEEPYLEKHTANSIYKVKYLFDSSSEIELLENEYIDKIGIMWSSGFESYPVYDVDFLQRQMKCLKHAK